MSKHLIGKALAVVASASALVALGSSGASAAYVSAFDLTVDGVTSSSTATLSSTTAYTVTADDLVPGRSYYVSTCIDPGTSSLTSAPGCAFFSGPPQTFSVAATSPGGTVTVTGFEPSKSFTNIHDPAETLTCLGEDDDPADEDFVQCAVVIVDATDHSLAASYDRVLVTVD